MRVYPTLTEQPTSSDFIETFGGYNHNVRIGENEFYDMKNLTSSYYPVLSTRQPRGTYPDMPDGYFEHNNYSVVGMIDKGGLCTLEINYSYLADPKKVPLSTRFIMGGEVHYIGTLKGKPDKKRTLISMGANIIIMPDKYYFNTVDPDNDAYFKIKSIEAKYETTIYPEDDEGFCEITYHLCKADGTSYTPDTTSETEPTDIKSGHIWLDTSVTPHSLKIYSDGSGMWSSVATTYIKVEYPGIGTEFEIGDAVRITGVTPEECEILNHTTENAASIIQAKDDDYIVVIGMMKNGVSATQDTEITVQRIMPEMDFVIENNNRLWGCRYGENSDGEIVNEIYASKLGDFKNWEYFAGTSQDSYVLSLGTDGEFTGAISYLGNPLFFRQNCIHTIYGSYPAQYQLQTTECRGVQRGCNDSLVIIDGVLLYKALGGVCAYTGSLPTEVGSALGEIGKRYYGAYAGAYRHKYYIGMRDALEGDDKTWLFVYDTEKGMWHKEDKYNGREFCYCNSESIDKLYYSVPYEKADGSSINYIKSVISEDDKADKDNIDWMAETGVIGCYTHDKKYISRISFRLSMDVGTRVYVFAEYDSSGAWEQIGAITGTSLSTFTFPVRPKRCDHLRLRLVGTGTTKIYSISKTLEQGSEI